MSCFSLILLLCLLSVVYAYDMIPTEVLKMFYNTIQKERSLELLWLFTTMIIQFLTLVVILFIIRELK